MEDVRAGAAGQSIAASAAIEHVRAGPAGEMIGAASADDRESAVTLRRAVEIQNVAAAERRSIDGQQLARGDVPVGRGQAVIRSGDEDQLLVPGGRAAQIEDTDVAADYELVFMAGGEVALFRAALQYFALFDVDQDTRSQAALLRLMHDRVGAAAERAQQAGRERHRRVLRQRLGGQDGVGRSRGRGRRSGFGGACGRLRSLGEAEAGRDGIACEELAEGADARFEKAQHAVLLLRIHPETTNPHIIPSRNTYFPYGRPASTRYAAPPPLRV